MLEYLQQALRGPEAVMVTIRGRGTGHNLCIRAGVIKADAVGVVVDNGGPFCVPWTSVDYMRVDYV